MTSKNGVRRNNGLHTMKLLAVFLAVIVLISATGCLNSTSSVKGNVSGKVYDSNGRVLYKARVEIYGGDHSVLTDELGRYAINDIEPGQKKLVATYEGKSVVKIVEIPRGGTLEGADLTFSVIDGLPPVITEVMVQNLTENSADIVWKTNEPSDSTVEYALGPVGLAYSLTASDTSMVTDHKVTITGLTPGKTYHCRVKSLDFQRNEGISSDYQFDTPSGAAPESPTNFNIQAPTEMEKIVLNWNSVTDADLAGYNLYRSESSASSFVKVNANPIPGTVGSTTYQDEGLKIANKYYYYVKAVDTAGNESAPSTTLSVVTPGILSENRTWRVSESPYLIQGDIRIRGGVTLTIEPGVEVKFTRKDSLPDPNGATMTELIVQGSLMAVGNETNKIVFTSAESFPTKANWGGIKFQATTEAGNILRFSTIMFADQGITSEGATPSIENCEFGLCGIGINIGLSTALNIRFNTIRDCDIGLVSANSNIRNNLFIDNQTGVTLLGNDYFEHNTVDCLIGVQVDFGNPTIKNNIIAYTGTTKAIYGINQTQPLATPSMSFNDIYNYTYDFNGTNGTGTSNISSDPLFIGGSPYDYHLQTIADGYASDSPCLTAGEGGVKMGRYGP
ncbi:MAG: hypothetical protein Kow0029_01190 [Candidatus Rifleibacteriota bacterium]